MQHVARFYDRAVSLVSGTLGEGVALFLARVALASVFWRSGRTKVVEGSWLEISDTTRYLFESDYSGIPIPPDIAAPMATYAEHAFPILLVIGLATRLSALSLLGMTLLIQFFVFPEAWWPVHVLWAGLATIIIVRGGGIFSLDALAGKMRPK